MKLRAQLGFVANPPSRNGKGEKEGRRGANGGQGGEEGGNCTSLPTLPDREHVRLGRSEGAGFEGAPGGLVASPERGGTGRFQPRQEPGRVNDRAGGNCGALSRGFDWTAQAGRDNCQTVPSPLHSWSVVTPLQSRLVARLSLAESLRGEATAPNNVLPPRPGLAELQATQAERFVARLCAGIDRETGLQLSDYEIEIVVP